MKIAYTNAIGHMNMNTIASSQPSGNALTKVQTCYIYCRVSTEEQANGGFSLDNQRRACEDFAASSKYVIKGIFVDEGKSARTTDRPEFQRMMEAAKKSPVDAVIFYKIDRLARNVSDFGNLRKEFMKHGD